MARVSENRRSSLEEEREEMNPVFTGISIAVPAVVGIGLGLALKSALSESEVPFEASREAIDRVEAFRNKNGVTFDDYQLRGLCLATVLTAVPSAEIPEDLDPSDLPSVPPCSGEAMIDYAEEHLGMDFTSKQRSKVRKNFEELEEEWTKRDKEKSKSNGESTEDDGDTEKAPKKPTNK